MGWCSEAANRIKSTDLIERHPPTGRENSPIALDLSRIIADVTQSVSIGQSLFQYRAIVTDQVAMNCVLWDTTTVHTISSPITLCLKYRAVCNVSPPRSDETQKLWALTIGKKYRLADSRLIINKIYCNR